MSRKNLRHALLLVCAVLISPMASAQEEILAIPVEFGFVLSSGGDANGDGVPDLLLGNLSRAVGNKLAVGEAILYSGSSGRSLLELTGTEASERLGSAVEFLGDLDQDGYDDFLVGTEGYSRVDVYSGATFDTLYTFETSGSFNFGRVSGSLGDIDGDAVPDFALGNSLVAGAQLEIYSGATGTRLHTLLFDDEDLSGIPTPSCVTTVGNLDGDGVPDFAANASTFIDGEFLYRSYAFSGASGQLLWKFEGDSGQGALICSWLGDVDQDGVDDLLSNRIVDSDAVVEVYSGATRTLLYSHVSETPGDGFGRSVAGLGDTNGDGVPDYVVGAPSARPDRGNYEGAAYLFSGATGALLHKFSGREFTSGVGDQFAAVGDSNQDGFLDLASLGNSSEGGELFVFAGNDLFLNSDRTEYLIGETVQMWVRGGVPGAPAVLALVEFDGVPSFQVISSGTLDDIGNWVSSFPVEESLINSQFTFRAFSIGAGDGAVIDSALAQVDFRLEDLLLLEVPQEYPTIQMAIDSAILPDSVIRIADGIYRGEGNRDLVFDGSERVSLESLNGPENCIIDLEGITRALRTGKCQSIRGFQFINGSTSSGGAILCELESEIELIENCIFADCSATDLGGAIKFESEPVLKNCKFTNCSADNFGGAIYCDRSDPTMQDCVFINCTSKVAGGAIYSDTGDSLIQKCSFVDNSASEQGGAIYFDVASGTVSNCLFEGNSAAENGGAIVCDRSLTRIEDTVLTDNLAGERGGAVYWSLLSQPSLRNCTVTKNVANDGGGLYSIGTFPHVFQSIFWNNTGLISSPEIANDLGLFVSFSNIEGGWPGPGNLAVDPKFVSSDDFHLGEDSPMIDAGLSQYKPKTGITDIDGEPRRVGDAVDLGADEVP